ncbi:hypothetical protein [Dactylosporangium salmoneum]|uniref:Nucleotidyltransferase n=1 Tax=Dactylosporangium salmoneum TaxID=53361 RepID=A0ABP5SAN9_9ACTN
MSGSSTSRPLRDLAELHRILTLVLDLVDPAASGFTYRLVGTAAALAQGVALPAGDVDLLVRRREHVEHFAAALSAHRCLDPPAWLPAAGQYFTHFVVDGIEVGASTVEHESAVDTIECIGPGAWTHYVELAVGPHVVPAVRLELRLVSELVRNRPDRYEPLLDHLRAASSARDPDPGAIRGCDATLRPAADPLRGADSSRGAGPVRGANSPRGADPLRGAGLMRGVDSVVGAGPAIGVPPPFDLDLVDRAMRDRAVPPVLREHVLTRLGR